MGTFFKALGMVVSLILILGFGTVMIRYGSLDTCEMLKQDWKTSLANDLGGRETLAFQLGSSLADIAVDNLSSNECASELWEHHFGEPDLEID